MSVTINAKGTSVPYFGIGKNGVVIYQGTVDPTSSHTPRNGDYWIDTTDNSLKVFYSSAWTAPKLDNITFSQSTIQADPTLDLILNAGSGKDVVINSGAANGPGVITSTDSYNLIIDPTLGGGARLELGPLIWPLADGTANQLMATNGAGYLVWVNNPLADYESRIAALEAAVYALQHP